MIRGDAACGNGSLDLHRGHAPIQGTLEDALGMDHDEMHVRMEEQGQNLAAVANDIGLGAEALEEILLDYFSPAIDNLLDNGTISAAQAEQYRMELEIAVDFRVNWDGNAAPPEFCTASI